MLIAILVFSIITFLFIVLNCAFFALIVKLDDKKEKKQDAEEQATCKDDEVSIMQEKK